MNFDMASSYDPVPAIAHVISTYSAECQPQQVDGLGNAGGFSGARFWRLHTPRGLLCLRRWPVEHPDRQQLAWIHAVLRHVDQRGFHAIPLPIATRDGETFVESAGHFWELTPWLSGRADFLPAQQAEKLAAAMIALAQWHVAASDFPDRRAIKAASPAVESRLRQIVGLLAGGWQRMAAETRSAPRSEQSTLAEQILQRFPIHVPDIQRQLAAARDWPVPLQPCIRDVWHGHVLFDGDRVTGLIDFGSLRIETVAGDVARLLGSMVEHASTAWRDGLAAYQSVRPLSPEESKLVDVLHFSGVRLAGMNWIQWLFVEGRTFDDMAAVAERLRWIGSRLLVT